MKRILLMNFVFSLCVVFTVSAQRTISGTITDGSGETIPGVNVVLKGTTTGVTSDLDGKYRLSVPEEGGILVFSFIGLTTQEVEVGARSVIDVTMESDVQQLTEVVVTGVASATDARKLPFTVASVKEDIIKNAPGVDAAKALQGKVAGVTVLSTSGAPGSNSYITLRGAANLSSSNKPLIIIDGVITEGDGNLSDINSEDIASMEVVKGAAAASLYGSRAANGVVNIRTKRGADKGQATTVTFRMEYGQSLLNTDIPLATHHPYEMNDDGTVDYTTLSTDQIADNEYPQINNQLDELYGNGDFSTVSVSVGSTSENTRFYGSFTRNDQGGVIEMKDGYQRNALKLNVDHELSKNLSFKASTSYIQSTNDKVDDGSGSAFYSLLFMPPEVDLTAANEEDGSPYNWDAAVPASLERNPLYTLNNLDITEDQTRYLGAYSLQFRPLEFLSFEGTYTIDKSSSNLEWYVDKGYLSDDYSYFSTGYLYHNITDKSYQTVSFKGTYTESFGDFNLTAQLYYLFEKREYEFTKTYGYDFYYSGLKSYDNSSLTDEGTNRTSASSSQEEALTQNYYAIVNVDYQDKLIIDGMIRRDESSLFGANNRVNTFYRTSLAYRLTEDITIAGVDELKFRGSIGTAGNRPGFDYQYYTYSSEGEKKQTGNPYLRSSLQREIEVGFDGTFLNGKITASVNYVDQRSTDMFWEQQLEGAAGGFQTQWINLDAQMDAKIWEATLGSTVFKKQNQSLDVNVVFSTQDQVLTKFAYPATQVGTSDAFIYQEGEKYGTMYGEKVARSLSDLTTEQEESGLYTINSDGFVVLKSQIGTVDEAVVMASEDDGTNQYVIGDIIPDFNMAFNFTYRFKGLTAYALIDWKQGGDVYNQTKQWSFRELRHADIDQSGVPLAERKAVNYYSSLYNTNTTTDYFVEDGSYVKLREVSLSYTFNPKLKAFKSVKVGVVGRNLLTITNYSGYDPEVGSVTDGQAWSFDAFSYPNFTTLSGSLEIKF